MDITAFREYAFNKHDVESNQKYNGNLPYSFHLSEVETQAYKYKDLLKNDSEIIIARMGAVGHDLIEDARVTYNDIINVINSSPTGIQVADVIYACTELRGRNRAERHGEEYFKLLKENRLALYVKLCDIIANVRFGIFTQSQMVKKYRMEFVHLKAELYREEFKEMFDDLQKLLNL